MAGALIVTAEIAPSDFAWLDALRKTHYPAERNHLPAHLTIFHTLPPSAEPEIRARLARIVNQAPPKAIAAGLMDLGRGVALRIASPDLDSIRDQLALDLQGLLSSQDSGGWRPHVTIQNKVAPKAARALMVSLQRTFEPRPLSIAALGLSRYLGGPWERLAVYPFRG
jgi:2'-5' RNA ligase superfamily